MFYFWVFAAKEDASTAHATWCRCRCRLWLNAYRLCALIAEIWRGWRALFVHLSLWHEVHGAGEGSLSQPGELPVEQLALQEESQPKFWSACRNKFELFQQAFQSRSDFSQQQQWYSGTVTNQTIVTTCQTENTINDVSLHIFRITMESWIFKSSVKREWFGFSLAVRGRVWAVQRKRQLPRHDHTRLPGSKTSQCFGQ